MIGLLFQEFLNERVETMPVQQRKLSFESDIKGLFRDKDVNAMKAARHFDLKAYDDVKLRADRILERLQDGDMPCDQAWSPDRIQLFEQWIRDGKLP